ncbi:MAG: energy transducer TonB [Pyrinomonadaceae bacterium]
MKAFEMNPVDDAAPSAEADSFDSTADETPFQTSQNFSTDSSFTTEQVPVPETFPFIQDSQEMSFEEPEIELDLSGEESPEENETFEESKPIGTSPFSTYAGNGSDHFADEYKTEIVYDDRKPVNQNDFSNPAKDDDFYVTVLTEKNVKQRNVLLLGSTVLMLTLCIGGLIASIFNHPLLVGAIGDDDLTAFVPIVEEVPMAVEKEEQKAKDKDAGGGGGGGREEETPTSKGRLATQTEKPLIAPTKTIVQKDFELKQPIASTQGNKTAEQTDEPYGDPRSKYTIPSDGRGSGSGQGSGEGSGQGSGRGTGQGTGIGSGSGNGNGDGNGNGSGSGDSGRPPKPADPKPTGPTKRVNFLFKPQPRYTDAARQNNIQGNVTLRITFLSNGQIGSISPVKGLPYGLTEQAIAAARQIRFEPALRNGQPQSVTMSVQYTFTIY